MNENNNQQQQRNDDIDEQLEQLQRTLHNLNIRQNEIRRQSSEVQIQIQRLNRQRRPARETTVATTTTRRDRHNDAIDIGDYVNFLTRGRYNTRSGNITQISHRRYVSARDRQGRIISREPVNVEIVRKYNEQHDQRRRYE